MFIFIGTIISYFIESVYEDNTYKFQYPVSHKMDIDKSFKEIGILMFSSQTFMTVINN